MAFHEKCSEEGLAHSFGYANVNSDHVMLLPSLLTTSGQHRGTEWVRSLSWERVMLLGAQALVTVPTYCLPDLEKGLA